MSNKDELNTKPLQCNTLFNLDQVGKDMFNAFWNCTGYVTIIKDPCLRHLYISKSFLEITGLKSEEPYLGHTDKEFLQDFLNTNELDKIEKYDTEALNLPKGKYLSYEFQLTDCNNIHKNFISKVFPIFDKNNKLLGIGNLCSDITSLKANEIKLLQKKEILEEKLHKTENNLENLSRDLQFMQYVFNNTMDGIIITDAKGNALQINPAFTKVTGYSLDEVKGNNPRILKSNYHEPEFYQEMWETLKKTGKWEGELKNRKKNGEIYPQRLSIGSIYNTDGEVTNYVGINNDLSELKQKDETIHFYAYHDVLTNLPNKQLFSDRLRKALSKANAKESMFALLYLDLDDFKKINDSLGYSAGDAILLEFSKRVKNVITQKSLFARISSDEFVLALPDIGSMSNLLVFTRQLRKKVSEIFIVNGQELFINTSIGISIHPEDSSSPEILIQRAETAMHQAKNSKNGDYRFYTSEMQTKAQTKINMDSAIRRGIEKQEFVPFYQPKVNSVTGKVYGMEALARWVKDNGKIIYPNQFIDISEELNLISEIDKLILKKAIEDMGRWAKAGHKNLTVSVNVSASELEDPEFIDNLFNIIDCNNIDCNQLELEITESALMQNVETSARILEKITKKGIKIAIDDFGTGYSSLAYLKSLPITTLKIDRSFVKDILCDPNDLAIVSAIISMAAKMGLKVVAEGVEDMEQVKILQNEDCPNIQGYVYSRPLPQIEFLNFINQKNL